MAERAALTSGGTINNMDIITQICLHSQKQPHQTQRKKNKNGEYVQLGAGTCDIPGCTLADDILIIRALSPEFAVELRGVVVVRSRIVLAEEPIDCHDDQQIAEAKQKVLDIAANPPRPLTLDMLNKIKRPEQYGYNFDEILNAIKPYALRHVNYYCSTHFPREDGEQEAAIGIMNALRTDRAIAPFAHHAFLHMRTKVRRPAATTGLIKHGERDGDLFGRQTVLLGDRTECNVCSAEIPSSSCVRYIWQCPQCGHKQNGRLFGSLRSADAIVGDDLSFHDLMGDDTSPDPLESCSRREEIEIASERVSRILSRANLSEKQRQALILEFGLGQFMDNPYDKETEPELYIAWEREGGFAHTGSQAAKLMGCSRQRVKQQRDTAQMKIYDAIDEEETEQDSDKPDEQIVLKAIHRIESQKPVWNGKRFTNKYIV